MSEYTSYCAVPTSTKEKIRDTLRQQQIISVVDDAAEAFADKNSHRWTVVLVHDEQNDWPKLGLLFGRALMLFVEENWQDWALVLANGQNAIRLRIYEKEVLNQSDLEALVSFFGDEAIQLKPFLVPGGQIEFCKKIGLPYLEILDQSILMSDADSFIEKGYSVLAEELY